MKLIFLHIPKTGGRTLEKILIERQRFGQIVTVGKAFPHERLQQWSESQLSNVGLLMGHIPFGLHDLFGGDHIRYLTFLRDPVERIVSHYYFVKRHKTNYLNGAVVSKNMSLMDYALSDLSPELDNGQVRLLANCENATVINEEMVDDAIENINRWFVGFGILERYDESLLLLKNALSWKELPVYRLRNVGHDKQAVSQEDRDAIRERNRFDVTLYQWALDELSRRVRKIDGFAAELQTFKEANKAYTRGYDSGRADGLAQAAARSPTHRVHRKLKSLFS